MMTAFAYTQGDPIEGPLSGIEPDIHKVELVSIGDQAFEP